MSQLTSREFPRHAWAHARHGVSSWVESLTDSDLLWRALRPGLLACVVGIMAGPIVVVVLNWRVISEYGRPPATSGGPPLAAENASTMAASASLPLVSATTTVSSVAAATLTTLTLPTTTSAPIVAASVAPMATSVVDAVAATASQTAIPETAEAAWQALQPPLESAWGTDTPRIIAMLEDFTARYPTFAPAREKLYAALMANADNLTQAGAALDAVDSLNRAASVLPERPEAHAALLNLTPTPTSVPPQPDQVASVPPPARQAANVARPAPQPQPRTVPAPILPPRLPATPTKAPFRPPAAP